MADGESRPVDRRNSRTLAWLLGLYCLLAIAMLQSPVDAEFSFLASIPPFAAVLGLVATHRYIPLSTGTYVLIVLFLSLHLVGTHYTYARTPLGDWLMQMFALERNPFDRIVHFSFGALLIPPIEEVYRTYARLRAGSVHYFSVMTILGLSAAWEIFEYWVARSLHPELGLTYLGAQGDVWDAQRDMAASFYGALAAVTVLLVLRSHPVERSFGRARRNVDDPAL
jgi:putative membrane protein